MASRVTGMVRFWGVPLVLGVTLLSALAALYLGGVVNPAGNLQHFPIAVVNDDAGASGRQIVDGLVATMEPDKFDIRVLSADDARHQLDTAGVYGAVLIPNDFSAKFAQVARSALSPGPLIRPEITIATNPRAGSLGSTIAGQSLTRSITAVNSKAGERLSVQLRQHTGGAPLPGAMSSVLASPIDIHTTVHNPLPEGTGNGLSAYYYALLLLLAGFTGSLVISALVDSMLAPAERARTLVTKWLLMVLLAPLTSAAYLGIAHQVSMPLPHAWALWGYGTLTIAAVGITSVSLMTLLGTAGLLISLLVFVVLGLPSAAATVPLEAAPPFFAWLAGFEPMHQVYLGTRALLYLDGRADAGLAHAVAMTAVGLVTGLAIGAVAHRVHDRRAYGFRDATDAGDARAAGTARTAGTGYAPVDSRDDTPRPSSARLAQAGWTGSNVIR